jgi:hypothetical protein
MKFPEIDSPFATFEGGSGYVLPNDLPSMAHDALQRLEREPVDDVLPSLLKSGWMGLRHGMQPQDLHNVWNFFIWYYLTPAGDDTPSIAVRIKLLDLMLSYSPDAAWPLLRSYILENIDDLSGWVRSFRKEMAEREQIWLDEEGNYYQKYDDGEVYRVVSAKTLEEARLDFFTEQIVRDFGNVRLFLKFFSWLAISDNFAGNPEAYHTSLKAMVQDRQWPSLNHRWQLLQWHTPRTFVWRPPQTCVIRSGSPGTCWPP